MKNFRLLVSIALTVSVLSLPSIIAQDNNSETAFQIVQPAIDSERDTIIEDAIHELNNNKVSYDGKAVTIYNVPNSGEKIKAILMMFLSLIPPTASILLNYNFENIFYTNLNHKMATAIVVLGVLTGLIILGNGLKTFYNETEYAQKNIPLVTLDDAGLLFKGRLISWDHIFKTKLFIDKIAGQTTLSLCDEYLNSKFELKKINTHCPITVDELASFINYYIDKKHPENAQLNQEKTTTGDSFITKFIKLTASNNLSFDGKKLTFYNVPNKSEMAKAALFMAIATAIGGLSVWLTLEVNPATMGTSGYLSMGVIGLMALGFFIYYLHIIEQNVAYGICNIPLIILTDKGISCGQKFAEWRLVKNIMDEVVKTYYKNYTTTTHTISLRDKQGKGLLYLTDIGDHLPITTDNLIAIMNHYIDKTKQLPQLISNEGNQGN